MLSTKKTMKAIQATITKSNNFVAMTYEKLNGGHLKVLLTRKVNGLITNKFFIMASTTSDVRSLKNATSGMMRWLDDREADTVAKY